VLIKVDFREAKICLFHFTHLEQILKQVFAFLQFVVTYEVSVHCPTFEKQKTNNNIRIRFAFHHPSISLRKFGIFEPKFRHRRLSSIDHMSKIGLSPRFGCVFWGQLFLATGATFNFLFPVFFKLLISTTSLEIELIVSEIRGTDTVLGVSDPTSVASVFVENLLDGSEFSLELGEDWFVWCFEMEFC
jgi:hypothetical protein